MSFIPLRVFSGYSFTKSGLKIDQYLNASKKMGYQAVGLCDYRSLSGAPSFYKEAKKLGLKPIVGEELEVDNLHFCLYPINEMGYKNFLTICNLSQRGECTTATLKEYQEDIVVVLPSDNDALKKVFLEDRNKFSLLLARLSRGFDHFYLGLEKSNQPKFIQDFRDFAFSRGYKVCAFPHIKYVKKEDAIILKMMESIDTKDVLSEKKAIGEEFLLSPEEATSFYKEDEIKNTAEIGDLCNLEFIAIRGQMIHFENEFGLSSDDYLSKITHELLEKKGKANPKYLERLEFELKTIREMGYSDYFLIVHDYVQFARDMDIAVGPGRGSAAGSLVAYVLGITVPDPIENNLLFERFLNPHRQTMPDIDVDFSDVDRERVVQYLKDKYGNDHVAKIIAIQKIGAKQSLRDVGRIFNYPKHDIELFTKLISDEKDDKLSLREIYKQNKKFRDLVNDDKYYLEIVTLASKIEGFPRQASLHAVGVVLNAEPLDSIIPLTCGLDVGYVEQFEKDHLEEQGFLKMDILAIRNLSLIDHCLALLRERGININRDEIPYDNPIAIKQIASLKTMGIFQLESVGMRNAIKTVGPTTFEDITAILALYRPGPMDNIPSFGRRKHGKEKITYISKALEEILSPTYGIMVYQEQVMQIANKMAGFSLAEADLLRRAISKKDPAKIASFEEKFVSGSIKLRYKEKEARDVYEMIRKFGDYGFNRSHAMVYAIFSCRMAYLKAKYPQEFYASILSNASTDEFHTTLAEMKDIGLKVSCPDINKSTMSFVLTNNEIIFPLQAVKGIMTASATAIIKERLEGGLFKDIFDFVLRMAKYKLNNVQLINLIDAGAFDSLEKSRMSLRGAIPAALTYADAIVKDDGSMVIDPNMFPKPTFVKLEDDYITNLNRERDALGLMVSGSPLDLVKDTIRQLGAVSIKKIPSTRGDIKVVCILKSSRITKTKKGQEMCFTTVYDDSGELELTVFNEAFEKSSMALKKKESIIVVSGYYSNIKEQFNVKLVEKLEDVKHA